MQAIKEKAANVTASAKSDLEKAKATVEEKVVKQLEKAKGNDAKQKEMASRKKEERKEQAELDEEEARLHNAVAKQTGGDGGFTATGTDANTQSGWIPTYPTAGQHSGARSFYLK